MFAPDWGRSSQHQQEILMGTENKVLAAMKAEGKIVSPKRCFWEPK